MKALVQHEWGQPDVLRFEEVERPAVTPGMVLVRVRAAAINALDWYFLTGTPYPVRLAGTPKSRIPCVDFAGSVETVGDGVTRVRPGDEVFGAGKGALAEYVCVAEHRVAPKPTPSTFEQAAAVPVAGLTALQGLRDKGQLRAGMEVVIHGASGGVGTFAIQIAKALGTRVTAVCRPKHVDLARSLGADQVIDTTREDFTRGEARYDLLFDVAGGKSWKAYCRVLRPHGTCVVAGAARENPWLGPLGHFAAVSLASIGGNRKLVTFVARVDRKDLDAMRELIEAGTVTPAIDACFEWEQAREAFRHFGAGHPRGKVVIRV
jgi:NADPH:quinone reductase-like Zn-dependent oxidoreductase